ncbi:CCA tRNA nucleotidyltransferase [Thermoproteota archaeon]
MSNWEQLKQTLIDELNPTEIEESQLLAFANNTIKEINKVLMDEGIEAVAELQGSVAHGTWIKGQQDLDIFIIIEQYENRGQLLEILNIVRKKIGWDFTQAYAEHPYLKTKINGYNIDIVPCFKATDGKIKSSTDRTPLHSRWLEHRLKSLEDEVRLLKQFLQTLDLYGAEIKVGGFSGYLCELLIIYYGGFWELLEAASKWSQKEEIRFEPKQKRKFKDPLTVIDPVDNDRNVASALREEVYWQFVSASRSFIQNPRVFFFKEKKSKVTKVEVMEKLSKSLTYILFIIVEESKADISDILWGQLHKSRQAIENQLTNYGFDCLRSTSWSNEENRHIIIYELRSATIPITVKHYGPPAYLEPDVQEFIDIYTDNPRTVTGPWIDGDKWTVVLKKKYTDAKKLMEKILADGGREVGVSKKIAVRILQCHRVLLNDEVDDYLIDGFEDYLWDWLKGRPSWLE